MDAKNPYQPVHLDPRQRRRSLIVIVSAGLGSILALVVLNLAVQPSRSSPTNEIELAPAAPPIETITTTAVIAVPVSSAPASTVAPTFVATLPPVPPTPPSSPTPGAPPTTVGPPPRWIPPDTPDFVRAVLLDNESLDVVAPFAGGTTAYFAVSRPGSAACGGAVYRVEQGQPRELVNNARYLFPRGDRRWVVLASALGSECRPGSLTIVDTFNGTAR